MDSFFFLKLFLHQNYMIVNITKLYGLPEKNHYRTDPSAFFSLLFFTDSWRSTFHDQISDELRIEDRNEKTRMNDCKHMNIRCKRQTKTISIFPNPLVHIAWLVIQLGRTQ